MQGLDDAEDAVDRNSQGVQALGEPREDIVRLLRLGGDEQQPIPQSDDLCEKPRIEGGRQVRDVEAGDGQVRVGKVLGKIGLGVKVRLGMKVRLGVRHCAKV